MNEWHEEVLDKKAKQAGARLAADLNKEFYLAGGTALALYFGHRISLDLDFFSQTNKLSQRERIALLERIKSTGSLEVEENTDGTCHLNVGGTAVSLFHYPYWLLSDRLVKWRDIPVASLEDIGAMKLSAVAGRGSKKDFIDIYWLAKERGLEPILESGRKKFADHPNFFLQAARSLVYFDDAEKEPLPKMLKTVNWKHVKTFFTKEVRRIVGARIAPQGK